MTNYPDAPKGGTIVFAAIILVYGAIAAITGDVRFWQTRVAGPTVRIGGFLLFAAGVWLVVSVLRQFVAWKRRKTTRDVNGGP